MRARRVALAVTLLLSSSCALIAGIKDIELTGEDGGGGAGGGGGDAAFDGGLNGQSCGPDLVCAPGPPVGWKFVAFATAAPAAQALYPVPPVAPCPDGYTSGLAFHDSLDAAPADCPCACEPDAAPEYACGPDNDADTFAVFNLNTGDTVKPCQNAGTLCGPGCCDFGVPSSLANASATVVAGVTFSAGGFCPIAGTSLPLPSYSPAQVCAVEVDPAPNTACPQGDVCARQSTAPYLVCVEAPVEPDGGTGGVPCPPGFPTQYVLAGGGFLDVTDTRRCAGTCACGADVSCGTPTVNFNVPGDGGSGCGTAGFTLPVNGSCQTVPPAAYESITSAVPIVVNGPCGVTTNTLAPEGGIVVNASRTVCCP